MQVVEEPGSHLVPGVHTAPATHVPPPVVPPLPVVPVVAPVPPPVVPPLPVVPVAPAPPSVRPPGAPPSTLVDGPVPPPLAIGSVPSAKQQVASNPSAVSVHELAFAPTKFAQGLPSLQRGGGGQVVPPLVLPAHARPLAAFTQTGAWGAKQQAPVNPVALLAQFCKVAPGYPAQAMAAVVESQVGGGGQVIPPVPVSPAQALPAPPMAKQIGAFDGKQQAAE
jgi:hypothetical protein